MSISETTVSVPCVLEKASDGISPSEAAERMGVSRVTIHNWIKKGLLPATRFGPRVRIDPADLEKLRRPA